MTFETRAEELREQHCTASQFFNENTQRKVPSDRMVKSVLRPIVLGRMSPNGLMQRLARVHQVERGVDERDM